MIGSETADTTPWHPGEKRIQESLGLKERMAELGQRVIRPAMPDQHRRFFESQPCVFLSGLDGADAPWATILTGQPGMIASPTRETLVLKTGPRRNDPALQNLKPGAAIGLLGIEFQSRRRNRMNGIIKNLSSDSATISVVQSFGNCPKYISRRAPAMRLDPAPVPRPAEHLTALDSAARSLIAHSDTFFIGSYYEDDEGARHLDVSHRGGKPGFVTIDGDGGLTIPDYAGNKFFNTLGNILETGQAGLLFMDFAEGHLLQMTGRAALYLDSPDRERFEGAERLWRFWPRQIIRRNSALPLIFIPDKVR
ncbi:pyridoxamine 5'-phosphate oxidase family protein [Yunchengibacter salinarum]|uniref:pyridoxamine 5'-phosphate oxidase family protein n=1 Tax=Yunchengibacter salinarum TaxID=3133399 RepID=UPI0035B65CDA